MLCETSVGDGRGCATGGEEGAGGGGGSCSAFTNLLASNMHPVFLSSVYLPRCTPGIINKIAHRADEFSTDAFGEMLPIICKCRLSKK